ncbi:C2H2 type zinc-finger-domain-containing protein [Phascolomyces articulosus]|uniref:C2H2 type zinc-finger-domain-containing protein n=1 Tax=Phascolomyces articulosus TaxID=60185 RepID=A0AAD5KQ93_9FUNG|nr:C2H2 type zinc-finger-domain-containing protein [Phascolomyces articulosus]
MEAPKPTSGLYTCLACQVAFESAEGQRTHYRSDWHRYNLKRKVADLPPVSNDQFQQKAEAIKEKEAPEIKPEQFKGHCGACKKTFGSKNSYESHIRSKKHKETVAKQEARAKKAPASSSSTVTPTENNDTKPNNDNTVDENAEMEQPKQQQKVEMTFTEETTEEEILAKIDEKIKTSRRLEETECLFCNNKAESFEDNMSHMTVVHSFFIPDIEYLVDLKGLIKYLGEKISVGNTCLHCNGKGREYRSLEAVRAHMLDKGHCMIAYETDEDAMELVDFYDFSSSYAELIGEGEDVDVDAELANVTQGMHLADDEMHLVLPNGNVVGHRSLKRYYDQKFKPEDSRDSVLINKLIGQYSDMQGYQSPRAGASHQARGGRFMITDGSKSGGHARHTEAFKDSRIHQEYQTRVGIQSNKLQKYFRIQII